MNSKTPIFLILVISLFLVGSAFAKEASDFTFKDLEGKEVSLSDYKGKVVLVNFWATWCGPCIHEMPDLEKLYKTYQDKGFQIIGLTVSSKANQIPAKIKKTGVSYPILLDAEPAVTKYGGFGAIPQSFLINRKGEIVKQYEGARPYKIFEKDLKKWL